MPTSHGQSVSDYLSGLPEDRKLILSEMRGFILSHLPEGYAEAFNWGMISYEVPLSRYPKTYNKQPLSYVALAAQKQYNSLYLMSIYAIPSAVDELLNAYTVLGLKPNLGKSCLRFKAKEDLPLDFIGRLIAGTSVEEYIAIYEASRRARR